RSKFFLTGVAAASIAAIAIAQQPKAAPAPTADSKAPPSSYVPVVETESFATVMKRMKDNKKKVEDEHAKLLSDRYDLGDHPASGVTMSRGKKVQEGVRVKLDSGATWESLASMAPEEIKRKGSFPKGFMPLPHPNHPEGGMLFPKFAIDEIKKQEDRDLTRFDLDFDLPDHLLPEFPAP